MMRGRERDGWHNEERPRRWDEERFPRWFEERHQPWDEQWSQQPSFEETRSSSGQALHPDLQVAMEQMKIGLQQAIAETRSAKKINHWASDGVLLGQSDDNWLYQFTLKTPWKLEEQASVVLEHASGSQVAARVVNRVGTVLLISARVRLPEQMLASVTVTRDNAWLLKRQQHVVDEYVQGLLQPAADLAEKVLGLVAFRSGTRKINRTIGTFLPDEQQKRAMEHVLGSEITIVVGPGGTGKSAVEALATCHFLKQGYSILTISHTNIATDNVFLRQVQALEESGDPELLALLSGQRIVRAGEGMQHPGLLSGASQWLTVSAMVEQRMGTPKHERQHIEQRREVLMQRLEEQERDLARLVERWSSKNVNLQPQIERRENEREEQDVKVVRASIQQLREEVSAMEAQLDVLNRQRTQIKAQIINAAQLVVTTATAACLNPALLRRDFDVVIIDEISMIPLVAVVLAVLRAKKRVMIAGDPMQLSPIVQTERKQLERELPELNTWVASDLLTYRKITIFDAIEQKKGCILLTQQGRMHPAIMAPLNHFIYRGMLTSRPETHNAPPIGPYPQSPLIVVDSSRSQDSRIYKPDTHLARVNEHHAQVAVALVPQILASLPPRSPAADPSVPRIGILTPYQSQVQLITQKARQAGLLEHIHVGTGSSAQALEFEVVIFDTVEAPTRQIPGRTTKELRPFSFTFDTILDENGMATQATRLLNVAHSRARYKLIYLAHIDHLHTYQPKNPENNKAKQRLLVELVDWTANEGLIYSDMILQPSRGEGETC